MPTSGQKFGVPVMVQLDKDRVICRFGRRIEDVFVTTKAPTQMIEVAAFNPSFYVPTGISGGHGNRREIHSPTYFYINAVQGLGDGVHTGPFFARRGLVIKKGTGQQVWATAVVHGIEEGDVELGKA